MSEVRCVVRGADRLGEGPCWDAATGRLYWFDIKNRKLNWMEPGAAGHYALPVRASCAASRRLGGLLIGAENGVSTLDTDTGALTLVCPVEPLPTGFRSNDGKIDVNGRFWWSVMDDDGGRRPGFVYRYDADGNGTRVLRGLHIPNTLSCSPDGRTFYAADSSRQTIYAYPMNPRTGALGERRVFAHTRGEPGSPDGSAVDAEGFLWNAQWGGWRIVRYDPDGRVDRIVELPVEQPTSCAFGGEELSTLYITTARDGLSDEALDRQPLAGSLLAVDTDVTGLALPAFDG